MKNQKRWTRIGGCIVAVAVAGATLLFQLPWQHQQAAAQDVAARPRLSFIHADGTHFVDENNKPVILKGCNLGNWLLNEMWMFGGCIEARDEAQLHATLDRRFGIDRTRQLMDLYRSGYITERDFEAIRSLGFNVVRLPIDYRLIQSDESPYAFRPDAFKWLDRAVDLAEGAGIYIILDLHSAPGGQSNDQCTGEAGQNKLWGNAINQQRTVDIWKAIAGRYHDRSNIAAYDLLNEPYADHKMDVRPDLRKLMSELYTAIRAVDQKHVVLYPGALGQYPAFYGDPHAMGQQNVAFTEHFYPGLFGDKPVFESHIRTLGKTIPARQAWLDKINSPYYIGEFNPVLDASGGAPVARAYFDAFAKHGWAGTLWSYKLIKPDGGAHSNTWYIATNAVPLPRLSLESSSYEEFEQFFKSLATVPMAVNQSLQKALTDESVADLPVSPPVTTSQAAPIPAEAKSEPPQGWSVVDIGNASPGSIATDNDGTVYVSAGGVDIFKHHDSFRFVSKPAQDGGDITARILSLQESAPYAKAGLMARWGDDPASAFAMVNIFPDGTVAFLTRRHAGEDAKENKTGAGALPVDLRLTIKDGEVAASYRRPGTDWVSFGSTSMPTPAAFRIGYATASQTANALTQSVFRPIDPSSPPAAAPAPVPTLLKNGSFEDAGDQPDVAADWTASDNRFTRETDWKPTHSGTAEMGYHHWQADSPGTSEISQDVPVIPGKRYRFSVFVARDNPKGAHDPASVELRLEGALDGHPVTLNLATLRGSEIGIGDQWSRLTVDGTALGENMRVRIITKAASTAPRGGALKFDDAALTVVGN